MHVAYGAITEEGHRPMRNAAVGFNLGPPHAAMADADAIDVERFRDDDVIDARRGKPAALRQIVHAAVAPRLFVDGAGDLERTRQRAGVDQRFDRDDGRRKASLHVASAPAIDSALL